MQGFIVLRLSAAHGRILSRHGRLARKRQGQARETVVEGLEQTPDAFLGLFKGANTGKMLVKL